MTSYITLVSTYTRRSLSELGLAAAPSEFILHPIGAEQVEFMSPHIYPWCGILYFTDIDTTQLSVSTEMKEAFVIL